MTNARPPGPEPPPRHQHGQPCPDARRPAPAGATAGAGESQQGGGRPEERRRASRPPAIIAQHHQPQTRPPPSRSSSQPAARLPASATRAPLHPSTPPERRQRRREERGEDRTGEGRAVAPHRPQFSRRGHNIANQPPTRPSQARRRPVIVRPPSPCRLPPAVNSAFGEFAEPQPETGDSRRENSPRPADHAPPAPGEPSHFRVAGNS